jgi:hypothetical protein
LFPAVPRVRGFREPLEGVESPVPPGGELRYGLGDLDEAVGFDLVENLAAQLVAADQPGFLEDGQVLGNGLTGKRDPPGQPASAYLAVRD